MFFLYATFLDTTPLAQFNTHSDAVAAGKKWLVGSNWMVRDTVKFKV